jgi:hypothetical protein
LRQVLVRVMSSSCSSQQNLQKQETNNYKN